jgi:hypothetical protein
MPHSGMPGPPYPSDMVSQNNRRAICWLWWPAAEMGSVNKQPLLDLQQKCALASFQILKFACVVPPLLRRYSMLGAVPTEIAE